MDFLYTMFIVIKDILITGVIGFIVFVLYKTGILKVLFEMLKAIVIFAFRLLKKIFYIIKYGDGKNPSILDKATDYAKKGVTSVTGKVVGVVSEHVSSSDNESTEETVSKPSKPKDSYEPMHHPEAFVKDGNVEDIPVGIREPKEEEQISVNDMGIF